MYITTLITVSRITKGPGFMRVICKGWKSGQTRSVVRFDECLRACFTSDQPHTLKVSSFRTVLKSSNGL